MIWVLISFMLPLIYILVIRPQFAMRFFQKGIQDEWHFVIGNGAEDQEEFYEELERQLEPQIKALKLKSGYKRVGNIIFRRRTMHFVKYGPYHSLTHAEPFGTDLKISWYFYFTRGDATAIGTGFALILYDIIGIFTGKTRDKAIAFASIGKSCAEKATSAILSKHEPKEAVQSGRLGDA